MNIVCKEAKSAHDLRAAFPIIHQLRTNLDEQTFIELATEAKEKDGYKIYSLYDDGEIAAVVGFMPRITLYTGRTVMISELVTDSNKRSKGYGQHLLSLVHNWAKENGYKSVSLTSKIGRVDAHRFYEEKMGYVKKSYNFKKKL